MVVSVAEEVDAGRARQILSQGELPGMPVAGHGGEAEKIIETAGPQRPCPLDQQMQEVGSG